ncbi:MAG: hypothetical protein HYY44_02080 [Deltaproteobacteria bacterium]|nr:hypothetical protein [Deltaproteobacteria bacterium]
MGQKKWRQEMLVALCVGEEGEKGLSLFSFASPEEEKELEKISRQSLKESDRKSLKERVLNLTRIGRHFAFEETHPDWFMERFRTESPQVFSLLLRLLTAEKSEKILERMTGIEKRRLSKAVRAVSPEVLEIVRHLMEKSLGETPYFNSGQGFSFEHLATLNGESLRTLLKDVGVEEICKAFQGLDPRIVRAFLARCSVQDAREVKERLSAPRSFSEEAKHAAQKHLLSLDLGQIPSDSFFVDIGFSILAKAVDSTGLSWVEACCTKLPLAEGYRLKRILHEKRAQREKGDEKAERQIMDRLVMLAKRGRVRAPWKDEREIETTGLFHEGRV